MADPVIRMAMERRDKAFREFERWERWMKECSELEDSSLDIPMVPKEQGEAKAQEAETDVAPLKSGDATKTTNGKGLCPSSLRGGDC